MKDLLSLLKGIKEKRKLILELSKADFKKRFVGSYFGVVWMFIQPMVTIAIYAFIFGEHGMKNAPPVPGASYVIWLAPGIIPWFYFSEILNTGTNCLQEYHYLVKKVVFEVEHLPLIKLISCYGACLLSGDHAGALSGKRPRSETYVASDPLLFLRGIHARAGDHVLYQRGSGLF